MEISPATGKILGMVMAYAVSSLGLLLAYYNYRKRIVKAEEIFTPTAKWIIALVCFIAAAGAIFGAAILTRPEQSPLEAIRQNLIGILVPVLIFAISFWLTWLLYRHFIQEIKKTGN
jgi:peptidoglycan biosynthesis protein MviN/MurJ (putative lipid II flippase)